MVSSTTTTSAGDASPDLGHGARHRGRRARPGLFDAGLLRRVVGLLLRPERFLARRAPPRRRCRSVALPQRLEGRADIGDHAGIDREIVGQPRRRRLDLQHLAARRERRAGRVPDLLEERPADHQHEVVVGELLGDARRIEGERAALGRMIGRKGIAAAQPLEPHRGADAARPASPGSCPHRRARRRRRPRSPGSWRRSAACAMASMPAGSGRLAANDVRRACRAERWFPAP